MSLGNPGRGEVYISSFPSGAGKWQVSVNGGNSPAWRHDGKELFYIEGSNDTMTAAEISERKESPVIGKITLCFARIEFPPKLALRRLGRREPILDK